MEALAEQKDKDRKAVVQWKGEPITITFNDVKNLICPLATDQETAVFLKTCQSLQLNPFANEVYLIKYGEKEKAATVIAIESYLKAAELNKNYDGSEAGIILKESSGKLEYREGAFLLENEMDMLVGGWARVHHKDHEHPTYVAVNVKECLRYTKEGRLTKFWARDKQAMMVRKTALKRGLVEAFPSLFMGVMASAEIGEIPEVEYRELPKDKVESEEGELPHAFDRNGEPYWKLWWAKQTEKGLTEDDVHAILEVESVKEGWVGQGRTLEEADEKINTFLAAHPKQPPVTKLEAPELPTGDDKLLRGWKIAKDGVERLKITKEQVSKWFASYNFARLNIPGYQPVELNLADFEKAVPPAGVSNEMLNRFVDSLVEYESNYRRLQAGSAKNGPGKKE
jgi:phage recombination protein Bet